MSWLSDGTIENKNLSLIWHRMAADPWKEFADKKLRFSP
jgi:hypothetical protein